MSRGLRAGLALIIGVGAVTHALAQQPRDAALLLKPGTGVLAGVVHSDDDASKPLRGAVVTLNHVDKAYADTTITDERGQFAFRTVPPGRYVIGATKEGFVAMRYGATRAGRSGTPIALAEGEQRADVRVALIRGAVLTGTVRLPDGDPASGVPVMLQRVLTSAAGRRYVDAYGGHHMTDDRGVFRIFGLEEGDYVLNVLPETHFMPGAAVLPTGSLDVQWAKAQMQTAARDREAPPPARQMLSVAAVYFPGVLQRADATVVTVGRGEVRAGLDVTLRMIPSHRVSGTLIPPTGEFSGPPQVFLADVNSDGAALFGIHMSEGATFSFRGVAPGTYKLIAMVPDQKLYAMSDVRVGDQDVTVSLTMQPGMTLTGMLNFDGKATLPDLGRVRIFLMPMAGGVELGPSIGVVKPDGTFVIDGIVPGPYRLQANLGGAPAWSLRSAMLGERDISIAPVEISPATGSNSIAVTLTDRPTELTGRLQDASGRAAADYFIIVFSTNDRAWFESSRSIAQTRPASDGQFTIRGLPPGEYFLAAVTDVERNEWFNAGFLRELVPASIRLSLGEGERKVQNIQIK